MTVEFISVGTELLLGNIVNTNAAYLAEKCAALGMSPTTVWECPAITRRWWETIRSGWRRQ